MAVMNPLDLPVHDGTQFAPRHDVQDTDHRDMLASSMATVGWVGAPIVADVETAQAITGAHRINAAHTTGVEIPAVDIFDLATACDVDLFDLIDEHGTLEDALPHLCDQIPSGVRDAYGLDVH